MITGERRRGLILFKHLIKRIHTLLQILHARFPDLNAVEFDEELDQEGTIPDDVKEGHFAVLAGKNEERARRFVVELCQLKNPKFLRLLELAEEEYGFEHKGALVLPCGADELENILQQIM